MSAAGRPGDRGEPRGLLKPKLSWGAPGPKPTPRPKAQGPSGLPSNAKPINQYTLDELKKMAASRGLSLEKLVAQMVQQYLNEDQGQE